MNYATTKDYIVAGETIDPSFVVLETSAKGYPDSTFDDAMLDLSYLWPVVSSSLIYVL